MIKPVEVRVSGVSKRFNRVQALEGVDTTFVPGEIHAVLGENGAGKSTLMGILAGFVAPDSGSIECDPGGPLPLGEPSAIRRRGISMVHQHFMLVPEFTVAENLALAQLEGIGGLSRVAERSEKALAIARELGWEFEPRARVRNLPVGVQQRLEILKALADDAAVLIFDEPTAVLSADEVRDLFRVLHRLREENRTIILIAHKLAEIMEIADRVTVLRHGRVVATTLLDGGTRAEQLAEWMVGAPRDQVETKSREGDAGPVVVKVSDLVVLGDRGEEAVRGVSFEIRRGEVLGIGGVDGNGQVELAEAICQIRKVRRGGVAAPRAVYVPQDRQQDGLALDLSIRENLWIAGHSRREFAAGPFLRLAPLRSWSEAIRQRFGIKADSLSSPVSSLSGGNQQKVVVGRSLDVTPQFLVVVNPTRGLDFNASAFVIGEIRRAASEGAAVALFSTDRDELAALADRQLSMSRGQLFESLEQSLVAS